MDRVCARRLLPRTARRRRRPFRPVGRPPRRGRPPDDRHRAPHPPRSPSRHRSHRQGDGRVRLPPLSHVRVPSARVGPHPRRPRHRPPGHHPRARPRPRLRPRPGGSDLPRPDLLRPGARPRQAPQARRRDGRTRAHARAQTQRGGCVLRRRRGHRADDARGRERPGGRGAGGGGARRRREIRRETSVGSSARRASTTRPGPTPATFPRPRGRRSMRDDTRDDATRGERRDGRVPRGDGVVHRREERATPAGGVAASSRRSRRHLRGVRRLRGEARDGVRRRRSHGDALGVERGGLRVTRRGWSARRADAVERSELPDDAPRRARDSLHPESRRPRPLRDVRDHARAILASRGASSRLRRRRGVRGGGGGGDSQTVANPRGEERSRGGRLLRRLSRLERRGGGVLRVATTRRARARGRRAIGNRPGGGGNRTRGEFHQRISARRRVVLEGRRRNRRGDARPRFEASRGGASVGALVGEEAPGRAPSAPLRGCRGCGDVLGRQSDDGDDRRAFGRVVAGGDPAEDD